MVLGLGSNLGDRIRHLNTATLELRKLRDVRVVAVSPFYESPPAGGPVQGDYVNAAVLIETELEPADLLATTLDIEKRLGRNRETQERWGPRTIDIDILWIRDLVVCESGLEVPHPRLTERPFALAPLLDLVPEAVDPRTSIPYRATLMADAPIRKLVGRFST